MMRAAWVALAGMLLVLLLVNGTPPSAADEPDPNLDPMSAPLDVAGSDAVTVERTRPPVVALVTMPAPSTSTQIVITLTNLSGNATVGPHDIQAVILDCHRALGNQGLTIDRVLKGITPPPGGTIKVTNGNSRDDVGPAILTFTGFNAGESVVFGLDPDSWEDPAFGATRADMVGCRTEVVFFTDGATLLRGDDPMSLRKNDSIVGLVRQSFP